jgi:hypothetical protein
VDGTEEVEEDQVKKPSKLVGWGIVVAAVTLVSAVVLLYAELPFVHPARTDEYEAHRNAIRTETGVDIGHFRDLLKGGRADGQTITRYSLTQLLKGISVEAEHTKDKLTALEIATDHLEEFPEYYTNLEAMEKGADPRP